MLALGSFSSFWVVLAKFMFLFGSLCLVLCCLVSFRSFQDVFSSLESFLVSLGFLFGRFGLPWVVLAPLGSVFIPFWVLVGSFGLFWLSLAQFRSPFGSF